MIKELWGVACRAPNGKEYLVNGRAHLKKSTAQSVATRKNKQQFDHWYVVRFIREETF